MGLKAEIESLEGLEPSVASLYVQKDGKYRLDIEGGFKTAAEVDGLSSALGKERTARENAEKALKGFKASFGGFDVEAGKRAIEQVEMLTASQKKAAESYEQDVRNRLAPMQRERDEALKKVSELESRMEAAAIDRALEGSKFLAEKASRDPIHQAFIKEHFRRHFAVEDGRIVATDSNGNKIFDNDGNLATVDVALARLVQAHPAGASLLAGSSASGSGSSPTRGGASSGAKVLTRAQFDALPPAQRLEAVKKGFTVVD